MISRYPVGILPDREIARALQCTVLVVTSPSFSVQDSKRFCAVARESAEVMTVCQGPILSLACYVAAHFLGVALCRAGAASGLCLSTALVWGHRD
jgi:hypothetical protein